MGINTRVIAFIYDKSDFAEEIKLLTNAGRYLSNRYNLRIGIVKDDKLVRRMRETHAELFPEVGMSCLVLRRYDGQLFKLNMMETPPSRYLWWMTVKSTKPVDQLSGGSF